MKKNIILAAIISLFLMATAISAQEKTINFSGNWKLDTSKSKLDERARIESMTMDVSQTTAELKVETTTKYTFHSEGKVSGNEKNGGGMIRGIDNGSFGDTKQTTSYPLDGRETKSEIPGIPIATTTLKAKLEKDGKLYLTSSRPSKTPTGSPSAIKETWTLSADGKTLKVVREQTISGATQSSEMVFTKS